MGLYPLVLATTNPAKLARLRWLLEGLPIETITPGELPVNQDPSDAEAGSSHEEIARHKALAWSHSTSLPAIASDGGLRIQALGSSWTSLHTQRFAGGEADDQERARTLMDLMRPFKGEERRATWVEALAVANEGRCLGSWEVHGAEGFLLEDIPLSKEEKAFWVFPLWYIPALGKTYDQLQPKELEQVQDHWAQLKNHVHQFFIALRD